MQHGSRGIVIIDGSPMMGLQLLMEAISASMALVIIDGSPMMGLQRQVYLGISGTGDWS